MTDASTVVVVGPAGRSSSNEGRARVLSLLFASHFLTYLDRAVMATAIPFIARDFSLSSVAAGSVLSAFFFGYALMQIPSGILADKFGPARLLLLAVLCWSVFTAMTGLVQSLAALIAVRILFGISEGPAPAAVSKTIAQRFARDQIGRTNGVVLAATLLGSAAAPGLVTAIVLHWGWRAAFLSLLVPGLLLALAVYLVLGVAHQRSTEPQSPSPKGDDGAHAISPWRVVFGSSQMRWGIGTTFIASCVNWGLQNWLPSYLLKARGFGVAEMGAFASLPYAAGALGYLAGGYAGDRLFNGRRNVLILGCLFASAATTYGAAIAPSGGLAVMFMTVTFLLLSMALSNLFTLPLVLVPVAAAGTAFGIVNTGAQIAGFLSPMLIGAVLDASKQNFAVALYLLVGLLLIGGATASRIK
jgi:MFS family permease